MEFEIKDKSKITEEDKIAVCKKYKDVIKIIYEIFDGQIFRKDLEKLCVKYHYCSESGFDRMMKILYHYSILKTVNIPTTEFDIVTLMNFAIQRIEKKKKVKSITVNETKLLTSQYKFYYINTHPYYNSEKNKQGLSLFVLRQTLFKHSNFHIKENNPVLTNDWIEKTFCVNKDAMDELKSKSKEFEDIRNSKFEEGREESIKRKKELNDNVVKNEMDDEDIFESKIEEKTKDAEDAICPTAKSIKKKSKEEKLFEEKVKFSSIRSKNGFIDMSNLKSNNINNSVEFVFFNTTFDFRDYYNRAKDIVEIFYLYTEYLNDVEHININLYFRDAEQRNKSFKNCFEFAKDIRGKVLDERQLFYSIKKICKSKLQYTPYIKDVKLDTKHGVVVFKYSKDIGNDETRDIVFKISFKAFNIYHDFYDEDKATIMIKKKEEEKAEKRAKKKELDDTVKELSKIRTSKGLDNLDLLCDLSKDELIGLIDLIKNVEHSKIQKLITFINNL